MHYCIRCHLNSMQYRWTCPEVCNYPILGGLGVWEVKKSQELSYSERATRQFFDALDLKLMEKLTRCSSDTAWVLTLCFDVFCMFSHHFILMFIIYKHVFADFADVCFIFFLFLVQFLWPFTLTPGLVDTASLTLASRERIPSLRRCWLRVLVWKHGGIGTFPAPKTT